MFARFPSLGTTASALRALVLPAAAAVSAQCAYSAIQMTREMDASPLKDEEKNHFSHLSSTVNAFVISHEAFLLISTLVGSGTWNAMSTGERVAIGVIMTLGAAGAGYSMAVFGVEQNTLAAGLSAAAGALLLNTATVSSLFFTQRRRQYQKLELDVQTQDDANRNTQTM